MMDIIIIAGAVLFVGTLFIVGLIYALTGFVSDQTPERFEEYNDN